MSKKNKHGGNGDVAGRITPEAREAMPSAVGSAQHAPGARILASGEDARTLREACGRVNQIQLAIGQEQRRHRKDLAVLDQQCDQAEAEYNAAALAIGRKMGLPLGEQGKGTWTYVPEEGVFIRTS